jgi:hypothetical protein
MTNEILIVSGSISSSQGVTFGDATNDNGGQQYDNSILGGTGNSITTDTATRYNIIGAGENNAIDTTTGLGQTYYNAILAGKGNGIVRGVTGSIILGGTNNAVSHSNAFIAGTEITSERENVLSVNNLSYYAYNNLTTNLSDGEFAGEIVYFGSESVIEGGLYVWNVDAGGGFWRVCDADLESRTKGMLAIACGTGTSNVVGMMVRGFGRSSARYSNLGVTPGVPLYNNPSGSWISDNPPSGSGQFVRVVGYLVDDDVDLIYFNPDGTWVEIA